MRFNDRELSTLSEGPADLEGVLHHMKPANNDWSDWYQQPSFKERTFKLISNMLFYFRVNEPEPLGVLILENAQIAYESPHRGIPFAFSITFRVNEKVRDSESKHVFSCRCDADVIKWVAALKEASYEFWRSQYAILKMKIMMKTGKDPVLDYMKKKGAESNVIVRTKSIGRKTASFCSHIAPQATFYTDANGESSNATDKDVGNLIDL